MADEMLDALNAGSKQIHRARQESKFIALQEKVTSLEARLDALEGATEENKPQSTKKK